VGYRVKVEAMGLRSWSGVDVQLYQEVCVSGGGVASKGKQFPRQTRREEGWRAN